MGHQRHVQLSEPCLFVNNQMKNYSEYLICSRYWLEMPQGWLLSCWGPSQKCGLSIRSFCTCSANALTTHTETKDFLPRPTSFYAGCTIVCHCSLDLPSPRTSSELIYSLYFPGTLCLLDQRDSFGAIGKTLKGTEEREVSSVHHRAELRGNELLHTTAGYLDIFCIANILWKMVGSFSIASLQRQVKAYVHSEIWISCWRQLCSQLPKSGNNPSPSTGEWWKKLW